MEPDPTAVPLLQPSIVLVRHSIGWGWLKSLVPSQLLGLSHTVEQHTVRCFFYAFNPQNHSRVKRKGKSKTVCHQPNRPRHVPFSPITPNRHKDAATLHHGASKATPSSLKALSTVHPSALRVMELVPERFKPPPAREYGSQNRPRRFR